MIQIKRYQKHIGLVDENGCTICSLGNPEDERAWYWGRKIQTAMAFYDAHKNPTDIEKFLQDLLG